MSYVNKLSDYQDGSHTGTNLEVLQWEGAILVNKKGVY